MESPDKKVKTPKLPKEKKPKAPPNPKVSKHGSVIRVRLDQEGNRIIATDKGNVITLALKLKSEKRRRQIGQITKSTRTLHLIRKRDGGHLHILSNSYGFNYTIIEIAVQLPKPVKFKYHFKTPACPAGVFLLYHSSIKYKLHSI